MWFRVDVITVRTSVSWSILLEITSSNVRLSSLFDAYLKQRAVFNRYAFFFWNCLVVFLCGGTNSINLSLWAAASMQWDVRDNHRPVHTLTQSLQRRLYDITACYAHTLAHWWRWLKLAGIKISKHQTNQLALRASCRGRGQGAACHSRRGQDGNSVEAKRKSVPEVRYMTGRRRV